MPRWVCWVGSWFVLGVVLIALGCIGLLLRLLLNMAESPVPRIPLWPSLWLAALMILPGCIAIWCASHKACRTYWHGDEDRSDALAESEAKADRQ